MELCGPRRCTVRERLLPELASLRLLWTQPKVILCDKRVTFLGVRVGRAVVLSCTGVCALALRFPDTGLCARALHGLSRTRYFLYHTENEVLHLVNQPVLPALMLRCCSQWEWLTPRNSIISNFNLICGKAWLAQFANSFFFLGSLRLALSDSGQFTTTAFAAL